MRKLALIATFCLACVADAAWALGLGSIEVYSSLNQPLRAEIPLFAVKPGEREAISVELASASAFERTGIEHADILNGLRFRVVEGTSPDQAIVQVTSAQSVREPFISMLVEISWPEGRLVREFTILLDPPVLRSGQSSRRPASDFGDPSSGVTISQTYEQPRSSGGGSYGPVREQETLWSIAQAQRPSDSISMDQMMQAIYQANPEAFDGSITRIRAGSMLRIPAADEIRATDPAPARRETRRERRASRTGPAPVEMDDIAPTPRAAPTKPTPAPKVAPEPQGELKLSPPTDAPAPAAEPAPGEATVAPEGEVGTATTPPATPPAATKSSAPIEIRDNSAKAIELLTAHANEHSARQLASDQLTAETTQATTTTTTTTTTTIPTPAEQPAATTAPETPPVAPVAAPPAADAPAPASTSPFVDEPATPETAVPPIATQPPAEEAPPASVDVVADDAKPPAQQVDVMDDSLPDAGDSGGFNPLLLGLGVGAVLLLALGASRFRKYRAARSAVPIAPIVLSQAGDMAEPSFGDTLEAPLRPGPHMGDTLRTPPEAPVARTLETTLQRSLPPEQTTKQFMAVSTPQLTPVMPAMVDEATAPASDPYADALGEVDIHIAYGLYDEAARLLLEPLAKSPERKDLHVKLLEVYFSANMPAEFEAQAKKMQGIVADAADPEWEKVCIMGRQLCPESSLFGTGGTGAGLGATADLDITSMLGGAQVASTPAVSPATGSGAMPSLDLDLSGFDLGISASPASPPPQASKPAPAPAADTGNTLDFNLDDFKLDAAPAASASPTSSTPDADNSLDIDLADFDIGTPAASTAAAASSQIEDDLLLSEPEGGEGQADTRLDLARAYMDMGEPDMAKTLLQEVIAQGNATQKQEARELLGRLSAL